MSGARPFAPREPSERAARPPPPDPPKFPSQKGRITVQERHKHDQEARQAALLESAQEVREGRRHRDDGHGRHRQQGFDQSLRYMRGRKPRESRGQEHEKRKWENAKRPLKNSQRRE